MSHIIFMARLTGSDYRSNAARAEKLLADHGFSFGRMQAYEPRGILFGDFDIQKWRNLSRGDREQLDGLLSGRHAHHDNISIEILNSAPLQAVQKLADTFDNEHDATIITRPPVFPEIKPANVRIIDERQFGHSALAGLQGQEGCAQAGAPCRDSTQAEPLKACQPANQIPTDNIQAEQDHEDQQRQSCNRRGETK